MMVAIGLGVTFAELARRRQGLAPGGRASWRTTSAVPAAAVGLLLLFDAHPMVAAGFLILAVCPGAPFGPPFTALARGNVAVAAALMVILAGSSAVVAPLLLRFLLPLVAGGEPLKVDAGPDRRHPAGRPSSCPCASGSPCVSGSRPWRTGCKTRPTWSSKVLDLVAVGSILVAQSRMLTAIRPAGFAGMLALLIASWRRAGCRAARTAGAARP